MESSLPLGEDVMSYQTLVSAPLRQRIDQAGVTLFKKEDSDGRKPREARITIMVHV
jgi:hypothetical protein